VEGCGFDPTATENKGNSFLLAQTHAFILGQTPEISKRIQGGAANAWEAERDPRAGHKFDPSLKKADKRQVLGLPLGQLKLKI
jgi:hypothetical protein